MQCILEKSDEFENSYPLLWNIFFLILIMLLLGLQQLCSICWLLHLLWNNKAFVLQFGRANKKNYCRLCVVYIRERRSYVIAKSMAAWSHFKSRFSVGVEGAGLKKYIFAPVRSCVFLLCFLLKARKFLLALKGHATIFDASFSF